VGLTNLPTEQETIGARCFQPAATFDEKEKIEQSIPERFEKIVAGVPDRLAVKMGVRSLTYAELNKAANRIARAILEKRGQRREPVALLFEHGIEVVAAIFGVLKACRFYVALDPSFPPERIKYILEDSDAGLVITNDRNLALVKKLTSDSRGLLNVNEIVDSIGCENPGLTISSDDFAHLLYTSGSTGQPKGALKAHRNTGRSAAEIPIFFGDRLSLLHSVSFGSSSDHLFSSLLNGASLFPFDIKSEGVHRLASWLREEHITMCHLSPALFRQLANVLSGPEQLPQLRMIRLSGAPITQLDFDLYKKTFSPRTFLKIGMGSTEAGRICSAILDPTFPFPKEGSAAGYPRRGKKILLLDEDGHEVGPNQVGEIAVKGRGLATGYWKKTDLTGAKFISDPNGGGERICLTGDLGRMLPDGFIVHLGRKDFMVKIRGYRVEIGEIERALLAHPQIKDAGVVAWDRDAGEKYLAAYVVPRGNPSPRVDELYDFLKDKLPDYMMPLAFVFLDSLPLMNGKLDRTALPLPDKKRPYLIYPFVPPRTEEEQKLVQIWQQVLDVRPIGIHDDFFDLGGHSLLAAKLLVEIGRHFQVDLPLHVLVKSPTIAGLTKELTAKQDRGFQLQENAWCYSYLVKLRSGQVQNPVFCFPYMGGFRNDFFVFARLARLIGQDYCFYGLQARGTDGISQPHRSVEEMADDYIKEIQTLRPHGPYFLIGECGGGEVAYETARQLRERGEKIALLALLDADGAVPLGRYVWHRCIGRVLYRIDRVTESWAWNYYRTRAWVHLAEIQRLKGTQRLNKFLGLTQKGVSAVSDVLESQMKLQLQQGNTNGSNPGRKSSNGVARNDRSYWLATRLRYRPRPYDGRVTLLVNEEWHEWHKRRDSDPTLGWGGLAAAGVEVHTIPGNHHTYITDNIEILVKRLKECLAKGVKESSI